jgi:hypothetical protein
MSTQPSVGYGPGLGAPAKLFSQGLTLRLGDFAREALAEESVRLGISSEELARFSVMYYLADHDSGRAARLYPPRIASKPPSGQEVACARSERAGSTASDVTRRAVRCP